MYITVVKLQSRLASALLNLVFAIPTRSRVVPVYKSQLSKLRLFAVGKPWCKTGHGILETFYTP